MSDPEFRLLVVCTANQCRSPMAEAVLRSRLERAGLARAVLADQRALTKGFNRATETSDWALQRHAVGGHGGRGAEQHAARAVPPLKGRLVIDHDRRAVLPYRLKEN